MEKLEEQKKLQNLYQPLLSSDELTGKECVSKGIQPKQPTSELARFCCGRIQEQMREDCENPLEMGKGLSELNIGAPKETHLMSVIIDGDLVR